MKFLAAITTFLLAGQCFAAAPCDVKLREGKITSVDTPATVQAFKRTPRSNADEAAPSELTPAEGKSFVVLNIDLAAARSISILDYLLIPEGQTQGVRAIALAHSGKPFSKTIPEVHNVGPAKVAWDKAAITNANTITPGSPVQLLFEVPAGQTRFILSNRLGALQKRYEVKAVIDSVNGSKDPVAAAPATADAAAATPAAP
ncbi:MAG: hypothetical protein RL095_650 [Verrucomicrobiota bacterium]|jgi:hypothetical protein